PSVGGERPVRRRRLQTAAADRRRNSTMTDADANTTPEVFLVDDDPLICKALSRGLMAEGFRVRTWESALAFLRDHDPEAPGCLVTDIAMPGLNGLELQNLLCARGSDRPIVFITGKGSIQLSVQAMRAGAVSFLPKPVHLAELAAVIREAIVQDARARQ